METLALYIHWPFCASKCPYCDFNSHVRETIDHKEWLDAYLKEMDHYHALMPDRHVQSIFFGGGTPSLMEPKTVEAIISRIRKNWTVANDVEITLEANPTSVEADKFKAFKMAGVDRVSIGVQSFDDEALKFLGREHDKREAINAIEIAASTFSRYSFDLMYARPEQSLLDWRRELTAALQFAGDHMSLYQLTIEKQTPFYLQHKRGAFIMPDDNLAADMFLQTQEIMEAHDLPLYEVSNHARQGEESRHNLTYWLYKDYAGIGPGAHGRLTLNGKKFGTRAHSAPEIWLEKVQRRGQGAHPYEEISKEDQKVEALMMGLRTYSGVDRDLTNTNDEVLERLMEDGFLTYGPEEHKLYPTLHGLLNLNAVLQYLI